MDRYEMELLVRPQEGPEGEGVVRHSTTAPSELMARRNAIYVAQFNGCWVSRFLAVRRVPQAGATE